VPANCCAWEREQINNNVESIKYLIPKNTAIIPLLKT
jgi:hypothetical protein